MSETDAILDDPVDVGRKPRRSVLSRTREDRGSMLRFVRAPDGQIVFDVDERLPGRGFWLEARRDAVDQAIARKALARAAGPQAIVAPDLANQVEHALIRRGLERIGLARRAGALIAGFDEVERAVRAGRVVMLVQALDAATDGAEKLARIGRGLPMVRSFDRRELGRSVGRDEIVHLGVTQAGHADALLLVVRRLAGFRAAPDALAASDDGALNSPMSSTAERQERLAS